MPKGDEGIARGKPRSNRATWLAQRPRGRTRKATMQQDLWSNRERDAQRDPQRELRRAARNAACTTEAAA